MPDKSLLYYIIYGIVTRKNNVCARSVLIQFPSEVGEALDAEPGDQKGQDCSQIQVIFNVTIRAECHLSISQ